jgi:hypothetical protein
MSAPHVEVPDWATPVMAAALAVVAAPSIVTTPTSVVLALPVPTRVEE